ncbi:serine protease nudel isoform X2 [Plodia interpunctella]|uniref:serine protease nudel isoform X2 n=1 Tax=Plodia interpunctella TaxID=58824 RepID=UPI00236802D1|nr:serine protease nudel isoform X2 [Plodia interpunctella]
MKLHTDTMSKNNKPEKSSSHYEGPPMSLAESKKNGRRLTKIGLCLWPSLLIIIGVIGILIAIKILLSNTGYISTTEIVSLKWISQTSENIQSKSDIFYQVKNETSMSNKKRSKRMAIAPANDTEKVNDIFSKYKDREILKAREIIANHKVECNEENKSEICKDLVTKLRSLRNTKNENTHRGLFYSFDNAVSENPNREIHPVKVPLRKYTANNVAEINPYVNLYPSPSYTVNNYAPYQPPPTPPLSETCLLARLLKDNQAHYKGLVPQEYNSQYAQHLTAYNRFPASASNPYPQMRDVEAQTHKVHPQDVDILMRYLTPKQDGADKMTSKPSNSTTREAQCPLGSLSCNDGDDCISETQWCDGNVDCPDASDEVGCSCKSRVDKSRLCDGYFDCPFGEDEMGCNGCSENSFSCEDIDVNSRSTCFTKEQRCNNIVDCPNQRDEFECNSLSPILHRKPLFAISNTEGYLYRNFRGDWFPVCKNPYMWAHDACRRETGLIIRPPFIQLVAIDNMSRVTYLNTGPGGLIHTSDTCFNSSAVYVTCPDILCGTRILSTSQLLRENTAIENRLFGRNKRFLLNRNPYGIFYGGRRRHTNKDTIENIASAHTKYNQENGEKYNFIDENNSVKLRGKRAESRVVGGRPSQPAAWPWMAAMYRNGMFHCGGVIINQHWIMSAAHCVHEFWNHYYEIQVGMLRRFSFSPQEQNHPISHIIVNHKYSQADMKNDLSLLRVTEEILFSRWVRPICLPGPDTAGADWLWGPSVGTMCTAVGWGATVEHGPDPDHMREVELPIWSDCKHVEDREGKEICAGPSEGGKDACQGDSGGPLLCRNPFNSQQWYVAGIVSHGDGCARKGEPGVYTRVSIFMKWIKHHISSSSLPKIKPKQVCPGFKCKSGLFKCLPDKRVCDKIIDCLDGEDERKCNDLRSFDNIFMSRANNDTIQTSRLGKQSKLENTKKIDKNVERSTKELEDDLRHASTIEISITKSTESESKSTESESKSTESDSSSEQITDKSIISRESKKDSNANEGMFAITSSREALESMSSVIESQSVRPERGDLKEVDLEDRVTSTTEIIELSTNASNESVTNDIDLFTDISTTEIVTPSDILLDVNTTEIIETNNTNKNIDEVESKSLIVKLLPTSRPINEIDNDFNINDFNNTKHKEIDVSSQSEKSKKLPDFNDKIEDIVFPELHPAKIRKKHLIPTEFECRQISQIIPRKYRCDHKADCEDGTDELDCTCTDYLTTFDKNLLCDGVFDCADGQDEVDCYTCPEDRFLCMKSQQCLPTKYVCDGEPQCPQKEDELDCFALSNGKELAYEFDGKPKINVEGFLTKKYKNDWHVVCEDTLSTKQQEEAAIHICRYLGFSSANRYMVKNINIRNNKLSELNSKIRREVNHAPVHFAYRSQIDNNDARHVVIKDPQILKEECVPNVTKTCMSLYVNCDRPLFDNDIFEELFKREANSITDRPWPWVAKIFVEGDYKCSGVLLDTTLVLIGQSCLWDHLLEQHTVVVVGSHRTINATSGPYEQVLKVESKTELFNSKAILLHLKEPTIISSMVKPMAVTSSNMPDKDSICVAVGQNEKNSTISMFLREMRDNCSIHNICFERIMKNKLCQPGVSSHRLWAGIISCHNQDGWYPAASFVDSRGECGVGDHIVATEIVHLRSSIRSTEKKILETKKEDASSCDGVRCGRGRCINLMQVCNGVSDCEDSNDESAQACEKKMKICHNDPHRSGCECSSNQLRCHNGNCISKELFNNGHDDCGDRTDEPDHLSCSNYLARVMPSGLCNGVLNCEDRSDEDPMFCKCFAEKTYPCGKTSNVNHCVAPDVVCDGVRDCPNGEDESTCIALNAPYGTPSGSGQVIVRSHGIWHTKCYPTENHTRTELEAICRELGFLSGHAKQVNHLAKTIPPIYNAVLLDPFSNVRLNNKTSIKLRNTQEPMAKGIFDNSLENCHPVYIECL